MKAGVILVAKGIIPDYEKIQHILKALKAGEDRSVLAKSLGYSNPKSLDIYMRRKGFIYDNKAASYIALRSEDLDPSGTFTPDKRLSTILSMFSMENADARKIAEITGFSSHIELAEFMKEKGFSWSEKAGNYTRILTDQATTGYELSEPSLDTSEFFIYLPMLRKLYENRDKLYALLDTPTPADNPIVSNTPSPSPPIELTLPEELVRLIHKLLQAD